MTDARGTGGAATTRPGAVLVVSLTVSTAIVGFGTLAPSRFAEVLEGLRDVVVDSFGPVYPFTVSSGLLLLLGLAVSPVGRVRLGTLDRPEFGWLSWVAMLLSAGVGLSFLFWGMAEPLIHLAEPPNGAAQPGSTEAARLGMRYSFLFWGPHAWAIYGLVAITVGYSSYRHGGNMLISAALRPLLGRLVDGPTGKAIDVLAVFAILFGVATSLGLGTGELNAALAEITDTPDTYGVKVAIIAGLMTVSTISAMTGLGRGIRILSLANITICGVLLVLVFLLGPTSDVLGTMGRGVQDFATNVVPMSLGTEAQPGNTWTQEWVYFFWAWWIAWAPFVGTFIARISRGRTIRSVVAGVVLVPGAVTVVWFSVFGGTALERERSGAVDVAATAGDAKSVAVLAVFDTVPLTAVGLVLLVPVLALLFITSADSASFMLGSTTSGGSLKPPRPLRLMWSFAAAFAAVLLLSGGAETLRNAAVVVAAPFTVVLIGLGASLLLSLRRDRDGVELRSRRRHVS